MSVRFSISYLSSCHMWLLIVLALFHLCLSDHQKSSDVLCLDGERQALINFKHGLIDETDRLASWVGEKSDCCRWAGIVCDNITGHVHEIHLRGLDGPCHMYDIMSHSMFDSMPYFVSHFMLYIIKTMEEFSGGYNQMLRGHLSPSLLELKELKYLDLSCNDFHQIQIPSFIGSLRNLMYLNLSRSNFGGMIPLQFGNTSYLGYVNGTNTMNIQWLSGLRWLHHLDLSYIDLSKATDWFQVINTLPSLVELQLSGCNLSDIHPDVLNVNVTSLSLLDLSFNHFENTSIPWWIFSLTSLVSLDISSCNFHQSLPSSIYSFRNLTSLESLYAHGNHFTDSPLILEGLSGNLKVLDMSYCGISSAVLDSIHNLTSLIFLDLSENQLTKAIPNSFGNLCSLREIDLSLNNFDNLSFAHLLKTLFYCKSPSLESLYIFSTGLSGSIPESIGQLLSMKMLGLSGNRLSGSIPEWIGRLSSLEELHLRGNRLNGSIPDSIGRFLSLKLWYLSDNQLSGNLPVTLGQLSKLIRLDFSNNFLTGVVTEAHFTKLVSLKYLNGEGNKLTVKLQVANWIPPFQLEYLGLNGWSLGPEFPLWLQSQRDLTRLDISNTRISSPLPPQSFWRAFPNLTSLVMSQNHMKGALTLFFPTTLVELDLSSNEFTGKLPSFSNGSLVPSYLDLSSNSLEGSLHNFLCSNGVKETEFLSLGSNHFSGDIPECWEKWSSLKILILENNNLSGEIPRTLGSLLNIHWLNMHGNKISGRIPSTAMNLSSLTILQLGGNELVGSIPPWFGTELTSLRILNLRSNNLDGYIPDEFCHISHIQILDLAYNKLSGNIPRCFNNFSVLLGKETIVNVQGLVEWKYASDTLVMKGQEYIYKSILGLVTLLDLSSNDISGVIPGEFTNLRELKSLNLSRNRLTGRIPENIGNMKTLESFDLSLNKLFGELPISLSKLNFLSSFNVSYNNLTGRIPISTQLQSFIESSFFHNQLCGAPLSDCYVPVEVPTHTKGDQKEDDVLEWGLIISIVLGLVTGFWMIVAPLIMSTSLRIAYFSLMSKLGRVYGY